MNINLSKLKNEADRLLLPMENTEAVTVLATVKSGSRAEKETNKGIAHFSEHIFFKGSKKRPSTMAISSFIEGKGGEFNAFTDKEYTGFYTKLPAHQLEAGLDFISDLISQPVLDPDEIEREKGVIVEEVNMYEDNPAQKVADLIDQAVWGDTPLGWPVIGTKETVTSFKREDFKSFIDSHYFGPNMIVAVAGNFADIDSLIEKYFGHFPNQGQNQIKAAKLENAPKAVYQYKKTEQTHFIIGLTSLPAADEKVPVLQVLTNILGGGMSSRMFSQIRERQGLCYYIYARNTSLSDTGLLQIHAGVDNNRVDQAIGSIIKELQKVRDKGITEEELDRAKEITKGRLILRLEDSEEVANFYTRRVRYNMPLKSLKEILSNIDNVTAAEIKEMARLLIKNDRLYTAIIGPKEPKLFKLE